MKKILLTLVLALTLANAHAADPVKQWGQLQVKGAQLCDYRGNPVVLRGVSFGWHNIWPRFYNKKAVKTLKTTGMPRSSVLPWVLAPLRTTIRTILSLPLNASRR